MAKILTTLPLVLVLAGPVAAADSPRQVIEQVTGKALDILGDKSLPTDVKKQRLQDVVYAYVDFETLSHLVLARNWDRFSPEQQKDFIEQFKAHLALTYGNSIENYKNERVGIEGEREEARGDWTVKTRILRGGPDDILVDYRLRKNGSGEWKVIDFIIESVSLVANYRSQFQSILGNGDPEKLLQLLRDKNQRGEPLKAPGKS